MGATTGLAIPGRGKICGAPRHGMPGRMVTVTDQSPSPRAPQGQSVLEAVLERITYANDDTGYTVARVATERTGPDLLTVVGPLLGAQVGESLRLTGRWSSHPRYGTQFEVHSYTTVLPATIQGIRRYLGSGLIKGIGPMMAERMVTHFGTGILPPRTADLRARHPHGSATLRDRIAICGRIVRQGRLGLAGARPAAHGGWLPLCSTAAVKPCGQCVNPLSLWGLMTLPWAGAAGARW